MTLAGLTTALSTHLAAVNLRLALLEGSEPQAAADAALDLVRQLLLESGMSEQESEVVLGSARQLMQKLVGPLD